MKEIKKIDKFLIKITTVEQQKRTENKIDQLYEQNRETARANGKIREEFNEQRKIVDLKDKEIHRLEKEIQKVDAERLDIAAKLDLKQMELNDCQKSIDSKIAAAKGGFTKEINKLKTQLEEKDKRIVELEKEVKTLTDRNTVQAEKINKLISEQKHTTEEFKNDGLPKSTKKALSGVIKKKNEEKGVMLKQVEKELETTADKILSNIEVKTADITEMPKEQSTTLTIKETTTKNKKQFKKKKKNKR